MNRFYFTFGSWEKYPYQNGYMVVFADNLGEAVTAFRKKYPDINNNTLNCADYYSENRWCDLLNKGFYVNQEPKEVLYANPAQKREFELLDALLGIYGMSYDLVNGKIRLFDCEENAYLDPNSDVIEFENTTEVLESCLIQSLLEEESEHNNYVYFSDMEREEI